MARLILVSNRLPVTVKVEKGELHVAPSTGGLATGLRGPHQHSGGLWIGWPGDVSRMSVEQRARLEKELEALRCVPLHLSPAEVSRYYDGFSNAVLWPLFHYLLDRIPQTSHDWDIYRRVNEKFADLVAARYQPGDLIWVHDYQLVLLPGLLRQRLPQAKIGFFLHIPFPASEVLRILPWREQVLDGLLGADLIGFHTFTYRRHFSSALLRILGIPTNGDRLRYAGRDIRLGVFAMGIDSAAFTALANDPQTVAETESIRRAAKGERILLGIDRLDYTKGIRGRILAFERLLEREPSLRGRVRLVQVAVPSRDKVESYQQFRREVNEVVGRINGAFGTVSWVPIHYVYRSLTERQVAALYRAADVMLVTPLRDGMNLVAKEFVTCRTDEDGVLVLSEFAGAAAEMGEALQVNPYDVETLASAVEQALAMPEDERRLRMRALRARTVSRDVHTWARTFIETLQGTGAQPGPEGANLSPREQMDALAARLRDARPLLLLLDYDGTLVPFARAPELAAPDRELHALLSALAAKPNIALHIISGRKKETMQRWLGDLPIGLHAEHGFWSRLQKDGPWTPLRDTDFPWKDTLRALMEQYTLTTPGSLLEEKTASLAWHYRMAEPELGATRAEEMRRELDERMRGEPLEILPGDKVLEVRFRGVNKGVVVAKVLEAGPAPGLIAAMGDDGTDEDLFRALPPEAVTVAVGFRAGPTKYRVAGPKEARALLERLT